MRRGTAVSIGIGIGALALFAFLSVAGATTPPFEVARTEVDARPAGGEVTVHVRLHAVATAPLDVLELAYCGAGPVLVSVDGSTVEARVSDEVLRAPLHSPIEAGQRFTVRVLTATALDREPPGPAEVANAAGRVLC